MERKGRENCAFLRFYSEKTVRSQLKSFQTAYTRLLRLTYANNLKYRTDVKITNEKRQK